MRWIGEHTYASTWIVLAPTASVFLAVRSDADWIATTLMGLAGLSWSAVLMPTAVRHAGVNLAGTVAALSGGLLALILGAPGSVTGQTSSETGILLIALLVAGSAAHLGQLRTQVDQRRTERQADERLAALAERHAAAIEDLRVELVREMQMCRCRRPWWRRTESAS